MKSTMNRIISVIAIVSVLLFALAVPTLGAEYATKGKTTVYDAPNGKAVGTLSGGKALEVMPASAKGWVAVEVDGRVGYVKTANLKKISTASEPSSTEPMPASSGGVQSADWFSSNIRSLVVGNAVTIRDFATGVSFQARGLTGTLHADMEPCGPEDTEKLLSIYGGKYSWNRRAVIVSTSSGSFAGSINGMPHGTIEKITTNNFTGVFCLHFTNSQTHGAGAVDPKHQAAIRKVLGG